jgi:hypothetical protein
MEEHRSDQSLIFRPFNRRRIRPCVCVIDRKRHIRQFLTDALEELDFVICGSGDSGEVDAPGATQVADLVVIGPSGTANERAGVLRTLAANKFDGEVLLLGPGAAGLEQLREFGEKIGLAMLPALPTPFGSRNLRDRILMGHQTVCGARG